MVIKNTNELTDLNRFDRVAKNKDLDASAGNVNGSIFQ